MVGASGAISGVLGAYTVAFPHSRVVTIVPLGFYPLLLALPARFFLLVWLGIQILSGVAGRGGSGVAWWAHIGGFLMGVLLMLVLAPRPELPGEVMLDER
jgi:membrane associated rhomboid family serine protease